MFRSPQHYRTFLIIVLTYSLDLVGFSIVFPVLAPLLLNTKLHFFSPDTIEATRTTIVGLLFAVFGIAQFIGAPVIGTLADRCGRYKMFMATIGLSVIGYILMAASLYMQSLSLLFLGRIVTGLCSGNFALAQSATADLTEPQHRSRAFGILLGSGGLGFVAGPWFGGKLANPLWLHGSGAFIFAAIAAFINLLMVYFFFVETQKEHKEYSKTAYFEVFKDIRIVFQHALQRNILIIYLIFGLGWAFFLIFSPTFLVQRFSLGADRIGDVFAYMALCWCMVSMFLNKELAGKFSLRCLIGVGLVISCLGIGAFLYPKMLWPYWMIIPFTLTGGALSWVNLGSFLSVSASENMQGRVMGASGAMWSIGQIVAPLIAGPLAGWNMYAPLFVGSVIIFAAFIYYLAYYKHLVKADK